MSKNQRNYWLDWIIAIVFLLTLASGLVLRFGFPQNSLTNFSGAERLNWINFHVISGFLVVAGAVLHVIWHWDWFKAMKGRPLRTLKRPLAVSRIVNRMIWISFISSKVFGLLAWLLPADILSGYGKIFIRMHFASSMAWMAIVIVHLVLHKKWIGNAVKKYSPALSPLIGN